MGNKDKTPAMTVGDLRKQLEGVPDEMKVFYETKGGEHPVHAGSVYVTSKQAYIDSGDALPRLVIDKDTSASILEDSILILDVGHMSP